MSENTDNKGMGMLNFVQLSDSAKQNLGPVLLEKEEICGFMQRLSGKDENGSKAVVNYQCYALEDDEESLDRTRVYSASRAHVEMSFDPANPGFYLVDIVFGGYTDPELKMLWGRLQRFKRSHTQEPNKTHVFYFNILERDSVTRQTAERDTLMISHVLNPAMYFLTREVPDMLAADTLSSDGELYGGNIVRMLVPQELVTFEITQAVDTSEIKGEVLREEDEARYLNGAQEQAWDE